MDLAKQLAIEAILSGIGQRRRQRSIVTKQAVLVEPRRSAGTAARQMRPHGPQRRCNCGSCGRCLDNARWEKIFNEKFADPDYYRKRPMRHASPLSPVA